VVAICHKEEDVAEEDTVDAALHMDVELHLEHVVVHVAVLTAPLIIGQSARYVTEGVMLRLIAGIAMKKTIFQKKEQLLQQRMPMMLTPIDISTLEQQITSPGSSKN
jgi:hypothetical protein